MKQLKAGYHQVLQGSRYDLSYKVAEAILRVFPTAQIVQRDNELEITVPLENSIEVVSLTQIIHGGGEGYRYLYPYCSVQTLAHRSAENICSLLIRYLIRR